MINSLENDRFITLLKTAFGPVICGWLDDPSIGEIMLNPDGKLLIESMQQGKVLTSHQLPGEESAKILKLVATFNGQVIDDKHPEIATELPLLNARFQGWLPPIVARPTFSIRKHTSGIITLDQYVKEGLLPETWASQLRLAIEQRHNILVVGGTSSGKTTFTNALLQELAHTQERLLILEDLPELKVQAPDVVHLRTSSTVSMRDLVKGTLRMRPDRIIIGEVRDGAALELLKAWNTGHPGGISTLHANDVYQAPYRLESLIQEVIPIVPNHLIVQAVNWIVHLKRNETGQRIVNALVSLKQTESGRYEFKEYN